MMEKDVMWVVEVMFANLSTRQRALYIHEKEIKYNYKS